MRTRAVHRDDAPHLVAGSAEGEDGAEDRIEARFCLLELRDARLGRAYSVRKLLPREALAVPLLPHGIGEGEAQLDQLGLPRLEAEELFDASLDPPRLPGTGLAITLYLPSYARSRLWHRSTSRCEVFSVFFAHQ